MDFKIPSSWEELSKKQMLFVFSLMDMELSADELKLLCLFRFSKCKVIGSSEKQPGKALADCWILKLNSNLYEVSARQLAEILPSLDWIVTVPKQPVRIEGWHFRKAVQADFNGVPFEKFMIAENLYQGFLHTKDPSFLKQIYQTLYVFKGPAPIRLLRRFCSFFCFSSKQRRNAFLNSVFFWISALKDLLAREFPDFFRPVSSEDENKNLLGPSASLGRRIIDANNAQLRALTKGDITKENEILSLDTWRALTELNAQAKEYEELQRQMNKK